jgi:hypothetical protein
MSNKLTKSNLFSILSNLASYLWFFSVIAFITVIILSTQNYTVDKISNGIADLSKEMDIDNVIDHFCISLYI